MAFGARIEAKGLEGASRVLVAASDKIAADQKKARLQAGQIMRRTWVEYLAGPASAKRLGPRKGFGGGLMGSIRSKPVRGGEEVIVGTPLLYARIHEFGGIIRPRRANYLTFPIRRSGTSDSGAQWVRVKEVRMPKRPHLAPSIKLAEPAIMRALEGAVGKSIEELSRSSSRLRERSLSQLGGQAAAGFTGRRGFA